MTTFICKRFKYLGIAVGLLMLLYAAGCGNEEASGDDNTDDGATEENAEEVEAWEPSEAVEYIAPADTGGGWDTLARTTSAVLEESGVASQPFPVVNVPGGGGAVGWAQIAAREGDPHRLFVTSPPIILVPLNGNSEYDHTNFTPVANLITDYSIVLVQEGSEFDSITELFAAIEADPEAVSVGGGSAPGSMDHISIDGAANAAGLDAAALNYIAFSGGGEAITNLLGGHVDAVITGVGEAMSHVQSGDVKVLAVSSEETLPNLPDAPTYMEEDIDFTFDIWRGVMGPPDMPAEAVAYYEQMFADMLETEEWAQARDDLGWIDFYQDHEEFGQFLDEQYDLFENVLEDIGLLGAE
jgi:putative tricarboxylic transport membrane protein